LYNCKIFLILKEESLQKFEEITKTAIENNILVRGYISCVMGCPYEGDVDPVIVNDIANKLIKLGCYEVSLGDTIGIGTPGKIINYKSFLSNYR